MGILPERWRLPNYLVIMLVVVFLTPFITRGARYAIATNSNDARDWLPPEYPESTELKWFQKHFVSEQFALVSWDGCTLGNTQKLELLTEKLVPSTDSETPNPRTRFFRSVISGPGVIEQLTSPPLNLDYDTAIERLEGSLVGPDLTGAGHNSRVTCLVVTLDPAETASNKQKRAAIEAIVEAAEECAIPAEALHMGGPPVDNVAIDVEGERTLVRLAVLAGITGLSLSYICLRSFRLTLMVFSVGVLAAGLSLALVFYYGIAEVYLLGMDAPRLGTVDAILMSMPAVVYVLGLSGSIHLVNYFRDARREHGLAGAAEAALGYGWKPCFLAAFTTAIGLASLYTSDITPIRKFGMYSAVGVVGTLGLLFTLLPAALHRFPPRGKRELDADEADLPTPEEPHEPNLLSAMGRQFGSFIIYRNGLVLAGAAVVFLFFGYGLTKIETSVQLLKLFDQDADIIHDYRWLETNLGNLVPMEVVLRVDDEALREAGDDPEADGNRYRMDVVERMQMVERVQRKIESLGEVGRALSAATFAPDLPEAGASLGRSFGIDTRRVIAGQLEKHRGELTAGDYLRDEVEHPEQPPTGELWRISARLAALDDIDYGLFVYEIRQVVEPVLELYGRRDEVMRQLHEQGKQLRLANITVVYHDPEGTAAENVDQHSGLFLGRLLREAGARVSYFNTARLPEGENRQQAITQVQHALERQDAVVLATNLPEAKTLVERVPLPIDLHDRDHLLVQEDQDAVYADATGPSVTEATIDATYTGLVPLVYKTQRQLLVSLQESMFWATILIAGVMAFVMWSIPAGIVAMIPNVFPIVVVFGALGWLGIKVDIGIMMTASVALGIAVDDTIHFWTWFRDGLDKGMERKAAVMWSYERCATAMFQTTIVGGLGLFIFATSTFTPTQQFGYLMVTLLSAALIGDLIVLPAILSSWVGNFFRPSVLSTVSEAAPELSTSEVQTQLQSQSEAAQQFTEASDDQEQESQAKKPETSAPATPHSHLRRDVPHSSFRRS